METVDAKFNHLLTSITFAAAVTDNNNTPDRIKATFYFEQCGDSFTEQPTMKIFFPSLPIYLFNVFIFSNKKIILFYS
jgi:hypothetical protein